MKTIKIIDLLNKIANGEEVPKRIRIDHWCYKFEWIEHVSSYYDKHEDIDLMSCLSMDKEELNYEVHEIEEEKKIPEKLEPLQKDYMTLDDIKFTFSNSEMILVDKINSIIYYLESKEKGE